MVDGLLTFDWMGVWELYFDEMSLDAELLVSNRIQGTGAYLRPSKNKPPCELVISRDITN